MFGYNQVLRIGSILLAACAGSIASAQTVDTRIGYKMAIPATTVLPNFMMNWISSGRSKLTSGPRPAVALDALRIANERDWGVDYNQVGIVNKFTSPAVPALTVNTTTIYAASFVGLEQNGPVVIESPAGAYGVIDDYWQRPILEIGPFGPDKGKGGKLLIVASGYQGEVSKDYIIG
jgi:hypothetical protein